MNTTRLIWITICLCLLAATSQALAGCGQAPAGRPAPAPTVDPGAVSPLTLDMDSDRYVETHRALFDYDPAAPLDVVETGRQRGAGLTAYELTYRSPRSGRVPATLLVPDGAGSYPAVVMMHGMPSNRHAMLDLGRFMARAGVVVILIDAPFARPENAGRDALTLTEQDRAEQVQLIVDLRRAVDLLLARTEVDPDRLAYLGVSYGGAMGGLLAGVEDRLDAYVLVVGDGGLVSHLTGPEDSPYGEFFRLPEARQQAWLDAMWPIEPLHYVGRAAPAALLFLNGTRDQLVPPADALHYQAAGSEPKTVLWYDSGHGLPLAAYADAIAWLPDHLVGDPLAAERLLLLDPSFRPGVAVADRLLLAWLILTAASLAYMLFDLVRSRMRDRTRTGVPARAVTWATGLAWALAGLFFGPGALVVYLWLARNGLGPGSSPANGPGSFPARSARALGSALWGASRQLAGGVLALVLLFALPVEVRDALYVRLPLLALLPLATGLLIYACAQWAAGGGRAAWIHARPAAWIHARRPLLTELAATLTFLIGAYGLVLWLGEVWIAAWYPWSADLSNPAVWAVLLLAAWAGALTTYPAHLWLIGRGLLRWGPET